MIAGCNCQAQEQFWRPTAYLRPDPASLISASPRSLVVVPNNSCRQKMKRPHPRPRADRDSGGEDWIEIRGFLVVKFGVNPISLGRNQAQGDQRRPRQDHFPGIRLHMASRRRRTRRWNLRTSAKQLCRPFAVHLQKESCLASGARAWNAAAAAPVRHCSHLLSWGIGRAADETW